MEGLEDPDFAKRALPSELDGPLPRKVQMNSTDASGLLVIAAVCLGLGGVLLAYSCFSTLQQMQRRAALRRDGRVTVGRVSATHGGHGDATVSYTFAVDGADYVGKAQMPNHRLILHEADQIAVRYLPTDPTVNHPADWEWSGLTDWFPEAFMLFFVAAGSVALMALVRDRKLARLGKVAEGVVTKCAPDKTQFRVEYEFRTENDVRARGSCDCWEKYEEGDRIWIMYLANKPQRNHSYPLLYFGIGE